MAFLSLSVPFRSPLGCLVEFFVGFNRYFVPNLPTTGSIELPPEESHHALRVRRETVGATCEAFDGLGHVARCRITLATKRDVAIEIESHHFEPNELPGRIRLAVAMPKGDRQKAVIEKAVELGVHELVPLICQRSVSLPTNSASDKWTRIVVEACKQCERNKLMSVGTPQTFESLIQSGSQDESRVAGMTLNMIAHPWELALNENRPATTHFDRMDRKFMQVGIAIGPEGGFTKAEVMSAIAAGWRQLDFGPRILRVETAVCVASIYASQCIVMATSEAGKQTE